MILLPPLLKIFLEIFNSIWGFFWNFREAGLRKKGLILVPLLLSLLFCKLDDNSKNDFKITNEDYRELLSFIPESEKRKAENLCIYYRKQKIKDEERLKKINSISAIVSGAEGVTK